MVGEERSEVGEPPVSLEDADGIYETEEAEVTSASETLRSRRRRTVFGMQVHPAMLSM